MPFYLRTENGGKILLEDLTGALILETTIAPPTVNYQAGGAGHPGRKRKREEADELFRGIERTLQEALGLVAPVVDDPPVAANALREPDRPQWSPERLETAVERLTEIAAGHRNLEARLARLREAIATADREARLLDDDEDTWLLMS